MYCINIYGIIDQNEKRLRQGPKVIKLEYSLKLRIKHSDWLLADMCPYFEFENELKFYNLGQG